MNTQKTQTTTQKWITTFFEEKDTIKEMFEIEGKSGTNFIPKENVLEMILNAPAHEQEQIKSVLVKIDFMNGDENHFLSHILQAVAL